jgi:SNF2 family DNA or RNA helicase
LAAREVYPWHESIKDIPGAQWWGRKLKAWTMPATPGNAELLLSILVDAGASVSPTVVALAREAAGREERRVLAADESLPLPRLPWHQWLTTDPWDHQKRGIGFMHGSSVAAIGAGMGTGKTLMAIGALNAREVDRTLLVAPVATFGVFPRELRLHSTRKWHTLRVPRTRNGQPRKISLADRWKLIEDLMVCGCGRAHLAAIGYEAMVRDPVASADLSVLKVQAVVYDECHRLKAAGGGASMTAFSWVNAVPLRWGLSGTLMPQGPWDVYGEFRALDPSVFGTNVTRFNAKYVVYGRDRDGNEFPKDIKEDEKIEFSQRFHSITYIPVVDLKLPVASHVIESFDLEPAARRVYDSIRDVGLAEISDAVVAAGGNPTPVGDERTVAPANAGVELLRFAQVTGGTVVDDDRNPAVVSTAKVAALGNVLERVGCRKGGHDGRSRPEPVVVFCRFRTDLDAIAGLCGKAGLRYREVSGSRKDGLDVDAKMHPECDVLGAQIASGGVGVDFTRARINVYYSCGYELWLYQQSLARSCRPGQTRQVLYVYLIANNTVDADVYTALARREDVVSSCVNAYLHGTAERDSEDLPVIEPAPGEIAGEPVSLPKWLMGQPQPPRAPAERELDEQAGMLALAGLEGF